MKEELAALPGNFAEGPLKGFVRAGDKCLARWVGGHLRLLLQGLVERGRRRACLNSALSAVLAREYPPDCIT